MRITILLFLAALSSFADTIGAQAAPAPKTTVISIQPLTAMFNVYSAEIEHAIAPTWTIGVGSSYWNHDDANFGVGYLSGDVKLRYYPEAKPFQGFSFGGQAGYTNVSSKDSYDYGTGSPTSSKSHVSGPTLGVALDYNWLLGPPQTFYVGLGVGAKKIFAKSDDFGHATLSYPTARVSVGLAF